MNFILIYFHSDKPKRITRRRNTTVDARKLAFDNDDNDTPSENTEAQPLKTRITNRRDNICEVNTKEIKFSNDLFAY